MKPLGLRLKHSLNKLKRKRKKFKSLSGKNKNLLYNSNLFLIKKKKKKTLNKRRQNKAHQVLSQDGYIYNFILEIKRSIPIASR